MPGTVFVGCIVSLRLHLWRYLGAGCDRSDQRHGERSIRGRVARCGNHGDANRDGYSAKFRFPLSLPCFCRA